MNRLLAVAGLVCLPCSTSMPCIAAPPESVVDQSAELETISTDFGLCDGPAWDGHRSLYIPDVKGGKLYRYIPAKKELQVHLDPAERISASFFQAGRLYLSENAAARISWLSGKERIPLSTEPSDARPSRRPNDLVIDVEGNIYYTLTAARQVMHVAPDGSRSVAIDDIDSPNGITMSPDASTLYVASYVPKKILAYPIKSPGKTGPGRVFAVMDDGDAKGADGMTIDRAGNVYCAGATDVWIWDPAGRLVDRIHTPTRPINCTFGDSDMRSLYITCFGGLYRQRMRISGKPPEPPRTAKLQPAQPSRPVTTIPETIRAHVDVAYSTVNHRKLLLDVFVPETAIGPRPAVLVIHGGGWLSGDKTKFRALSLALAQRGFVTAAIEYRLGGEALFPAAINDCFAAVRYLRSHAEDYGIDPMRIGAVGGSAGGHLVGLMATGSKVSELLGASEPQDQSPRLQAAIVMAGPMEMITGSVADRSRRQPNQSNSNRWLGRTVDEAPELYRLADAHLHISAESAPTLFMVGEHDQPRRNEASRLKFREFGIFTGVKIYEDGKHGCWNQLPWFNDMVLDMDRFFREHL